MSVASSMEAIVEIDPVDTGIEDAHQRRLAHGLRRALADTWVLLVKTQGFHWNVVGPHFYSVHKLTEEQYEDLFSAIDRLGERIRALGHPAPQSFADIMSQSEIEETAAPVSTEDMLCELAADHETTARRMRETAGIAAKLSDNASEDLLTERLHFHETANWMLKAMSSG